MESVIFSRYPIDVTRIIKAVSYYYDIFIYVVIVELKTDQSKTQFIISR